MAAVEPPWGWRRQVLWFRPKRCARLAFMDSTEQLHVNLTSQDDIRAKLPEAKRIFAAKQEALRDLRREVANWASLIDSLALLVGEPGVGQPETGRYRIATGSRIVGRPYGGGEAVPLRTPAHKESPAQDRAIAGLERAGEPMGPTALYRFMESQDLQVPKNPNALGAALWNAAENGRIKRTGEGLYALLEWDTDQPELQDASPNDSVVESDAGPSENGASQPLSPAGQPQEGA